MLLANLVATPFLIRLLGPARYGLWALLQTSILWASFADIGMASASTKFGAEHYARGSGAGEASVVWSALVLTGTSTTAVAVIVAVEAPYIIAHLLHVRADLVAPGIVALRIVCAYFVVSAVTGIINTPLVVRLRWRQYTIINVSSNLAAAIAAPVALAIIAGGVVTTAAVGLCTAALGLLAMAYVGAKLQPALRRPALHKGTLGQLLRYGGALAAAGIASIPLSTAGRLFLAHNRSTVVVAYFAVASTLATTLNVLPEQVVGPLLPGLTRLAAAGRVDELRGLYQNALSGLFLVLTPATIILAMLAHPFLSLWAGAAYGAHSTAPFLVIIAGVAFGCLAWVPYSYLLSSGHTKAIAYIYVAEIIPYLAVTYVLTSKFGALGAALALLASYIFESLAWFALARRTGSLRFSPFSERRWRAIAAAVCLGGAATVVVEVSHGFVPRLLWAGVVGALYAMATWRLVLTGRERRGLSGLVREAVRRPRYGGKAVREVRTELETDSNG